MNTISIKTWLAGMIFCAMLTGCKDDESITRTEIRVKTLTATPEIITVAVGGIRAVKAEVSPLGANQQIYWRSANPEVAEVANGIIMGVSAGSTVVTVSSIEDRSKQAEVNVTVVAAAIPVEQISLGVASPLTVYTDETVQLPLQVTPADATNQELLWKNSNPQVATVSPAGLITPLERGTTTLTVYAASDVNKTATLTVIVTNRSVPVESINVPASLWIVSGKQKTAQPEVLPIDATNKAVTWESSNTGIATVSNNGVITAVADGKAVITVRSVDNPAITATIAVTVNIFGDAAGYWRFDDPANLGKAEIGQPLTPVPASGYLTPVSGGVRVGASSYFTCTHGITAPVTNYSMLFDFAFPSSAWRVFYQGKPGTQDEGQVYMNGTKLGHGSYSSSLDTGTAYRLLVTFDGTTVKLYINGASFHSYTPSYDYRLDSVIRLFTDGWGGYDNEMDIFTTAIWDHILTNDEIAALGVAE